jgi:hypothetical protein
MPTRTADDQPFDFNLDAYVKGMDFPPFRFHWRDRRWEMAHFEVVDAWEIAKAIRSGDDEKVLAVTMGDEQFADFRKISIPQGALREMVREYFKHCGVDPGEFLGSTDS